MNNLIAISGKKNSGKNTVADMIRYCVQANRIGEDISYTNYVDWTRIHDVQYEEDYEIKRFADKLEEVVCIILGCTREQLEDKGFREKVLGEQWSYWYGELEDTNTLEFHTTAKYNTLSELDKEIEKWKDSDEFDTDNYHKKHRIELTPKRVTKLFYLELTRLMHPNIWINALFNDYHAKTPEGILREIESTCMFGEHPMKYKNEKIYPKWIITDLRFPNELKAVRQRDGVCIRVNRPITRITKFEDDYLESSLDSHQDWDYVIENKGSLEYLLNQVYLIVIELLNR